MKRTQRGDAEIVLTLIFALVSLIVWFIASSWSCSSRWADSGLQSSWGPIKGCLVKTASGRWVPDDRVRDVDLEPRKETK